jgi:hypothetical protein
MLSSQDQTEEGGKTPVKIDGKKITAEELAACVSTAFHEHGIDSLLVGGACISIYAANQYVPGDLDG